MRSGVLLLCGVVKPSIPTSLLPLPLPPLPSSSPPSIWTFMMHPKPVIIPSNTTTKRGHSCTTTTGQCQQDGTCSCGPVSKRLACSGGEGGGEDTLADSLFSLVTVAEQQRQAQERSGDVVYGPANHHLHPLSCSAPATLTGRQSVYPRAERLITFSTSTREYPHLRPVPLQELSSLKLFRAWVRKSFEMKDDCTFILIDRSSPVVEKDEDDAAAGLIDSDAKLSAVKDIEIVEVSPDDERAEKEDLSTTTTASNSDNISQTHHDLILYAKSILVFLSEKGHPEARSIVSACPSSFSSCGTPSSLSSSSEGSHPAYPLLPLVPLHNSANALMISSASAALPPVLPRILAQAPPCLIPGYYIFSPVFDSFGEKRKLPIKIEIPRALVFNGERYKTVSTYIGLGPFGNDPNSFVKLEGDHLVGTVASRLEDDEVDGGAPNPMGAHVCTYVFKNLRLKTRSLIRTVLDVSYNGMRTGRFFFMVDNEVLPNTSRRFEIKAPSGYTIKMVNKTARSNPVVKHTQPTSPPQSSQSQPSSPTSSRPPSPPEVTPPSPHYPLSQSQPLPAITLPPRPATPPSSQTSPTLPSPHLSPPFPQLQLPPAVLMQMKQAQKQSELTPQTSSAQSPRAREMQAQAAQQHSQSQAQAQAQAQAAQQQTYQQIQSMISYSQAQQKSPRGGGGGPSSSPPTMPKGFPSASTGVHPLLAPVHTQIHTHTQQLSPQRHAQAPMTQQLSQQSYLVQQRPLQPQQLQQLQQLQQPQQLQKQQQMNRAQMQQSQAHVNGQEHSLSTTSVLSSTPSPTSPHPLPSSPHSLPLPSSMHHAPPPAVVLCHRPVIA